MTASTAPGGAGPTTVRRPRAPGYTYAVIGIVLVVLVAAVALTATLPPPPSVAEFAPQALQQIKQPQAELSSNFGSGGGPCAAGAFCPEAATTVPTTTTVPGAVGPKTAPRVHQCYGNPPRQIEDPQSPPCVASWVGNNGGATARGVTGDTILISFPDYDPLIAQALEGFFNQHFEFYGRKIKLLPGTTAGAAGTADQQAQDADNAYNNSVFASMMYQGSGGYYYYRELVQKKIVSATNDPEFTEAQLKEMDPYIWQYPMAIDREFASEGAWACQRLVGRNADHAGTGSKGAPRKFGIIAQSYFGAPLSAKPLRAALNGCGVPDSNIYEQDEASVSQYQNSEQQGQDEFGVMLNMKNQNVTTIFCECDVFLAGGGLGMAATREGYFPEWVLSTYFDEDTSAMKPLWPAEQLTQAFGVSVNPREWPTADTPSFWMESEQTQPSQRPANDQSELQRYTWDRRYRSMLILASGIQMAGPHLTAQTFADALHRTVFPNPDSPLLEGKVGFDDGGHSFTRDSNEWWWGSAALGSDAAEGQGALCYVDAGARRPPFSWPSGPDPFFTTGGPGQPACSSGNSRPAAG